MKVDAVILWVDGNDSKWQEEYNKYCKPASRIENGVQRYRDWDTLRYVIRGIEYNLPWIDKIHFVTCGQKPSWMVGYHPKLNFVHHNDIFENDTFLPTFNSSAIELNLSRIKGLSERFIYFNDDMLVLKNTPLQRFFVNDLPVDFLIEAFPRRGLLYEKIRSNSTWVSMINNCTSLINRVYHKNKYIQDNRNLYYNMNYGRHVIANVLASPFKQFLAFKHYHHPQAYLKKTLQSVEREFPVEFNLTCKSRFREHDNISQALFRYYQLVTGSFYPCYYNDHACVNVVNKKSASQCIEALHQKRFVCINDEINDDLDDSSILINDIIKELDLILPNKSSFEI